MPVCHCMGLHQEWADSADATTVAPTLVGREKARHCPLRKVSTGRRSCAGTFTEKEPQLSLRQHRSQRGRMWKLHIRRAGGREATTSPGALALSLALEISDMIVLLAVIAMRRTMR